MPKKPQKKEKTKKKTSPKRDEILKELAEKLKSEKTENEESELEEEAETFSPDFSDFVPRAEMFEGASPVLEEIANAEDVVGPKFVQVGLAGPSGAVSGGASNGEPTYIPSGGGNEPTYVASTEQIYKAPEAIDMAEIGRGPAAVVPTQEVFFQSAAPQIESQNQERINVQAERVDMQNIGRQNPIEAAKEEYKKYDVRKESSY